MNAAENISRLLAMVMGAIGFILGVALVLKPELLQKLNQRLGRRFSFEDKIKQVLDKEINTDKWFITNSRVVGIIVVVLALIILLRTI